MDTTTLIGLGLSAAMLLKQKQSEDNLKKQINNLKEDAAAQNDYIDNKLTELNKTSDEYIKKYITVSCKLEFVNLTKSSISFNALKWFGRFSWCIKNNSNDKTFIITKEKAVFSLFGNRCKLFVPGATQQVTIQPGQYIENINSTWQQKLWFSEKSVRKAIVDKLTGDKGKWFSGDSLRADITLVFATTGSADNMKVTWENVEGQVKAAKGVSTRYSEAGYNAVNENW